MISTPVFMRTMIDHPGVRRDRPCPRCACSRSAARASRRRWCARARPRSAAGASAPTDRPSTPRSPPAGSATIPSATRPPTAALIGAAELRIVDPADRSPTCAPGDAGRAPRPRARDVRRAISTPRSTPTPSRPAAGSAPAISRAYDGEYLTIVDRLKDVIIRGGENISAQEVEALLVTHPDVAEAACVAVARPGDGRGGVRVRDRARRRRADARRVARASRSRTGWPASSCRRASRCARHSRAPRAARCRRRRCATSSAACSDERRCRPPHVGPRRS